MHSVAHSTSYYCCNYYLQLLYLSLHLECRKCMNYKQMGKHIKHCFRCARYHKFLMWYMQVWYIQFCTFWKNKNFIFFSWIWQWHQISIKLVLSWSAANFNSGQNLLLLETFLCYLISFFFFIKKILKCFPKLISLSLPFFILHQMIALQKPWKMLFISSKKLFYVLEIINFL